MLKVMQDKSEKGSLDCLYAVLFTGSWGNTSLRVDETD